MSVFEQPKAEVQIRKAGDDTCILDVQGELTAFAEDALMTAYSQACDAGVHDVILNFEELEYMSSSGIGLLVTLLIRAQRRQQRLLAYGLSDHYRHILELTRLNEAITVYDTETEALAGAGTSVPAT
ncbi:MAG: STAS domain-containing protein [Anaerolineae bacterium]|jgi:anti-sigma B factor antagonist